MIHFVVFKWSRGLALALLLDRYTTTNLFMATCHTAHPMQKLLPKISDNSDEFVWDQILLDDEDLD